MSSIDNDKFISQLSIPGTHDSGALYEPVSGVAKCQNLTISEQLQAGVRYIDIRCRRIDNSFTIYHGPIYQHANFDDILNDCNNFLKDNPSETIIMSVKEEYNASNSTKSFEEIFNNYINKNKTIWYLNNEIPTLGEVRGKIVLVRRFKANNYIGIDATNWKDNTTFTINNKANLFIQDCYKVSDNNHKWDEITKTINSASSTNNNVLYLNYTSGYKSILGIPKITSVSNDINGRLRNYLPQLSKGKLGILVMDFAEEELCNNIINKN